MRSPSSFTMKSQSVVCNAANPSAEGLDNTTTWLPKSSICPVNGPNPGIFAREAINDFAGSIRGSVIDNDPFRGRIQARFTTESIVRSTYSSSSRTGEMITYFGFWLQVIDSCANLAKQNCSRLSSDGEEAARPDRFSIL